MEIESIYYLCKRWEEVTHASLYVSFWLYADMFVAGKKQQEDSLASINHYVVNSEPLRRAPH